VHDTATLQTRLRRQRGLAALHASHPPKRQPSKRAKGTRAEGAPAVYPRAKCAALCREMKRPPEGSRFIRRAGLAFVHLTR
jgi:hypothetical protein